MSFEAKFPGRCAACDDEIHAGELVKYVDDELVHVGCEDSPVPAEEVGIACTRCWCVHAGECL